MFGRDADLEGVESELARSRLVTVQGPPGVGKTRLATELVHRLQMRKVSVAFCDVTESVSARDILVGVATALGVSTTEVAAQLAARPLVLVIDNAEHVAADVASFVDVWLGSAPELRVVVTTRIRLRAAGEVVFDLAPLDDEAAVGLFVERARAVRRELGGGDEAAIRDLVRKLDGLPLAIELAAARARLFEPSQLLAKLDRSAELLEGGPSRTKSLAAALELSYGLLSEVEQRALAQASVFRGGFTIDAAEAVIDLDGAPVVDALEALVDHSLLWTRRVGTRRRLGLYLVVREFAAAHLDAASTRAAHERHARHFLRAGSGWLADVVGANGPAAIASIAADSDNLLAVHRRALAEPDRAADALDAAVILDPLLVSRGPIDHDLAILDQALAAAPHAHPRRLAALESRANAMRYVRLDEALAAYADLERAAGAAGSRYMLGRGIGGKGVVKLLLRDTSGEVELDAALAIQREVGDKLGESISEASLGHLALYRTDLAVAREHFSRALALTVELRDPRNEAFQQGNLGLIEQECGRLLVARSAFERAIDVFRSVGDRRSEAWALANLGCVAQEQGYIDEARAIFRDTMALHLDVGSRRQTGIVLSHLGRIEHWEGALDTAQELYQRALVALDAAKSTAHHSLVTAMLASVLADLGVRDAARLAFDRAEHALRAASNHVGLAAVEVLRGHLDLADGNSAAARRRLVEGLANIDRLSVRFARIGLERALARVEPVAEPDRAEVKLVIGAQARWFQIANGARVDLGRRRQLCVILAALVAAHHERPGAALSIEALLATAWPSETVLADAGASRVYVAISTLRRMGLRDLLQRIEDGYRIAPTATVIEQP
jgi:predicted ATPase